MRINKQNKYAQFFMLFIAISASVIAAYANDAVQTHISYCLRIDTPSHIKHTPCLNGYYKGYRLSFQDNVCTVIQTQEAQPQVDFMLVITPEIKQHASESGSSSIERYPDKPCRVFFLTLNKTKEMLNWNVEEIMITDMPIRLSNDALIILCDPVLLEPIKSQTILKNEEHVIEFPPLCIKETTTEKELNKSLVASQLAALDSHAFHAPPVKRIKETDHGLISLTSLARK